MIPCWIIEKLKEKEKEIEKEERPFLELPIEEHPKQKKEDVVKSNVVIININGEDEEWL